MYKLLIIFTISGLLICYVFATNSYMLETLPWDSSAPFKHNIAPYLAIFLCIISPYVAITTLFGIGENKIQTASQTEKTIGVLKTIEYSSYRINNSPMFQATILYDDITKTFDAISEKIQFNLEQGDEVVIYYNPSDKNDSFFHLDESIDMKNSK